MVTDTFLFVGTQTCPLCSGVISSVRKNMGKGSLAAPVCSVDEARRSGRPWGLEMN